jgi:hypothetical protein
MSELELQKLKNAFKRWNPEDYKYISLGFNNYVGFTNDLDCDGHRYWSYKSFKKQFIK